MPQTDRPHDEEEAPRLTDAVLDVIARHCRPCEHVLVLTSRTDESHRVRLAALKQSASRLGRTVETRTVDQVRPGASCNTEPPTGPESVPGLIRPPSDLESPDAVVHRTPTHGRGSSKTHPEASGTVIAIVDSCSAYWVDYIPWNALLRPAALLAFITFSHREDGAPAALSRLLADTAHRLGLAQLDQIALPDAPDHVRVDLLLFMHRLPGSTRRLQ